MTRKHRLWRRLSQQQISGPASIVEIDCSHQVRHGRACPGHPRLSFSFRAKTWMPGRTPGMTKLKLASFSLTNSCAEPDRNASRMIAIPQQSHLSSCLNNNNNKKLNEAILVLASAS
jgi:hypothetical protein